jgi:hypothetical protein
MINLAAATIVVKSRLPVAVAKMSSAGGFVCRRHLVVLYRRQGADRVDLGEHAAGLGGSDTFLCAK